MNLKQFEYLEAVYRLRNFTKAANELYISQPSMSSAIHSLETELGATLINRDTRPLSFTKAGEEFMFYVHRILNDIQSATDAVQESIRKPKETLNMALAHNVDNWLLLKIYSDFHDQFPEYSLSIYQDTHEVMTKQLSSGKLSLAYTLIPENCDLNKFDVIPVQQCVLHVVMNAEHPLAKYDVIAPEQLHEEHLIIYPTGSYIRNKLDDLFLKYHVKPNYYSVTNPDVMRSFAEQNKGITFIAADKHDHFADHPNLVNRPLSTPIYMTRGFILKKGVRHTAVINAMINYIQQLAMQESSKLELP